MTVSPRPSVIILGGLTASPLGASLINRLVSQQYGLGVIDSHQYSNGKHHFPLNRFTCFQNYDPGIPGDLDFVVRQMIRKNSQNMKFMAIIDLGYCQSFGQYNSLCSLVPVLHNDHQRIIYILIHPSGYRVGESKLNQLLMNAQFITQLIEIPSLLISDSCMGNFAKIFLSIKNERFVIWDSDIARFISDHVLRFPITYRPCTKVKLDGHRIGEYREKKGAILPPDLLFSLWEDKGVDNIGNDSYHGTPESLYHFHPTDLLESVKHTISRRNV